MRTDPRKACKNAEERRFWALVHDGIAHPLMAFSLFAAWSVRFHDWTSHRAWPRAPKAYGPKYVKGSLVESYSFEAMERVARAFKPYGEAIVKRAIPQEDGRILYQVEILDIRK